MSKYGFSGKYFSFGGSVKDEPPTTFIKSTQMDEVVKKLSQTLSQIIDDQFKQLFSVGTVIHVPHMPNITCVYIDTIDPDLSLHASLRYRDSVSEVL